MHIIITYLQGLFSVIERLNDEITPIRDCYRFAYFHDMTVESLLYQAVDRVDHNLMQAITKYN